jgi:hypothetical protein
MMILPPTAEVVGVVAVDAVAVAAGELVVAGGVLGVRPRYHKAPPTTAAATAPPAAISSCLLVIPP